MELYPEVGPNSVQQLGIWEESAGGYGYTKSMGRQDASLGPRGRALGTVLMDLPPPRPPP